MTRNDSGLGVVCNAVNSAGSDSWHAKLTVTSGFHPPPVIDLGPANQTLPLETEATFRCVVRGQPPPVINWYKDHSPVLTLHPRISMFDNGSLFIEGIFLIIQLINWNTMSDYVVLTYQSLITFSVAHISDLQKSDEGLYTCVASSEHGKATWSAKLRLESLRNPDIAFFKSPTLSALPGPPSRPLIVSVQRSSVTLSWSRHSQLGSSSLLGYQVHVMWEMIGLT